MGGGWDIEEEISAMLHLRATTTTRIFSSMELLVLTVLTLPFGLWSEGLCF